MPNMYILMEWLTLHLFTDDGNSKLINFDLTDEINTFYPKGYNRPDVYILYLKDGFLSLPILVSDFKKEDKDYDSALNESIGYFQIVVSAAGLYVLHHAGDAMYTEPIISVLCWPTDNQNHATIRVLEKVEPDEKFFRVN